MNIKLSFKWKRLKVYLISLRQCLDQRQLLPEGKLNFLHWLLKHIFWYLANGQEQASLMVTTLQSILSACEAQKMQLEDFNLLFKHSSSNTSSLITVQKRNLYHLKSFWSLQTPNKPWHCGTRFQKFCGTWERRRKQLFVFLEMFLT